MERRNITAISPELALAISGVSNLIAPSKRCKEMTECDKIFAAMAMTRELIQLIYSGQYLSMFVEGGGIKAAKLKKKYADQILYLNRKAYTGTAMHQALAVSISCLTELHGSPFIDEIHPEMGDLDLQEITWQSAALFSALHVGIDKPFFSTALRVHDYTSNRTYPQYPASVPLTEEEVMEVKQITTDIYNHYQTSPAGTNAVTATTEYIISKYGTGEDKPNFNALTTVRDSSKAYIAMSKAARKQFQIALNPQGAEINVGGTGKWEARITARIGGQDAGYTPDPTHRHIQDAIAQIGEENGWPITVTPAQVYRTFAGLDRDAVVYPAQEEEMEAAIDAMLHTPAEIDFTQQAEKHPKSHRDKEFDYSKAKLQANLLTGEKGTITRNGERHVAYEIYTPPVFYRYSKAVGQIKVIDRKLISGTTTPKRRTIIDDEKPQPAAQRDHVAAEGGTRNTVIRRYLADRITDMQKETKSKKKPYVAENHRITFQSVADESGTTITPKTIRTIRTNTQRILNEFVELGQIKRFEVYQEGRALKGVEIFF